MVIRPWWCKYIVISPHQFYWQEYPRLNRMKRIAWVHGFHPQQGVGCPRPSIYTDCSSSNWWDLAVRLRSDYCRSPELRRCATRESQLMTGKESCEIVPMSPFIKVSSFGKEVSRLQSTRSSSSLVRELIDSGNFSKLLFSKKSRRRWINLVKNVDGKEESWLWLTRRV